MKGDKVYVIFKNMRINIDLKYDTIIVSGLLITEKSFSSEETNEALIYIQKCIEIEKQYNRQLNIKEKEYERIQKKI